MRKMLLSFKADVLSRVVSGEKIYEQRNVFPDEPIEAYLYVSSPIKSIVGIMHLNNRMELSKWKEQRKRNCKEESAIVHFTESNKYIMEITDFQNTNRISLDTLRRDLKKFIVPQMYYYIDNTELYEYLKDNLYSIGPLIQHKF